MFFRPEDGHGLPHNPFKAVVAPRPIGWISSVDKNGNANLAPYSFFNGVADTPPMVMFSATGLKEYSDATKDSIVNVRETGQFIVNIVSADMKDAMNASSGLFEHGDDEFVHAGLEKEQGHIVDVPFVKGVAAAMECELWKMIDLPGDNTMVIGSVKGIHLNDAYMVDGIFEITKFRPLARCGYRDYATVDETFALNRPYKQKLG